MSTGARLGTVQVIRQPNIKPSQGITSWNLLGLAVTAYLREWTQHSVSGPACSAKALKERSAQLSFSRLNGPWKDDEIRTPNRESSTKRHETIFVGGKVIKDFGCSSPSRLRVSTSVFVSFVSEAFDVPVPLLLFWVLPKQLIYVR